MISLLHEKDYELLGNVEIRQEQWRAMREVGRERFIASYCEANPVLKVLGLLAFLTLSAFNFDRPLSANQEIDLGYLGLLALCGLIGAYRVWYRMERRFMRDIE